MHDYNFPPDVSLSLSVVAVILVVVVAVSIVVVALTTDIKNANGSSGHH